MRAGGFGAVVLATLALMGCQGSSGDTADASADYVVEEDEASEFCVLTLQREPLGECARLAEQYAQLDAGVDAFLPNETMREYEPTTIRYAITRLPANVQGEDGEVAIAVDTRPDAAQPSAAASMPPPTPGPLPEGPTQAEIDQAIAEAEQDVTSAVTPGLESGEVETRLIKMARRMRACLDADPSFTIAGDTCQTIDTFERPIATWRWTVTPTEPGDHTLTVQSSVELTASDGTPRLIPQDGQNATIAVEVTPYGRWKRFLDKAEAWIRSPLGVLAALTALVGAIGLLIGAIRRARRGEGPKGD